MISDIRIGFTAGVGQVCWAIRRLDRAVMPGGITVPSRINHVLLRMVYEDGPDLIFQSHAGTGVALCFFSDLTRAIAEKRVKRYAEKSLRLCRDDMDAVIRRLPKFEGAGYDYRLIALYYLAIRLGLYRLPSIHHRGRYTCNELVTAALAGIVPWITDDGWQTPEALFAAAFQCPSPVWFDHHQGVSL